MKIFQSILLFVFLIFFLFLCKAFFLGYYPDFSGYYYGPKAFLSGGNPYLTRQNFFTPFVYPPFVLIFFIPLIAIPFQIAEILWTVVSFLLLFASLFIFLKMYKQKMLSISSLLIGILICLFFPVKFSLGMGQINIVVFFLITLGVYFYNRNKNWLSGFLLGLSILLKFFPVLVILYLGLKKQWSILLFVLSTIICGLLLAFLFLGPSINFYFYLHIFPGYFSGWKGDYYNQSFSGVLMRAYVPTDIGEVLRNAFSLLGLSITFIAIFLTKIKRSLHAVNLSIGCLMTISLLANNFSWQHHFVWLLFPLLATFYAIRKLKNNSIYYVILGFSYILVAINLKNPQAFSVLFQSHVFFGAFMLWILDIYLLIRKEFSA